MLKIIWDGVVFHATGVATHHRNMIKALLKQEDVKIQILNDFYRKEFDEDDNLKKAFEPIDANDPNVYTIFTYHPTMWNRPASAHRIGFPVHEGIKLPPDWTEICNSGCIERLFVPSKATKNLFFSNGVRVPINIIPEGVDIKQFNPTGVAAQISAEGENAEKFTKEKYFVFLNVSAWTGQSNDRKGTDALIKAFAEEFDKDEKCILYLKVSAFWQPPFNVTRAIDFLGITKDRPLIVTDNACLPEKYLPELYRMGDCFVFPTRGEAFGLPIIEAMACGLPIITTKNYESGHMDFQNENTFFVDMLDEREQGDERFYCKGNTFRKVDIISLRKQMRTVFEMSETKRKNIGKENFKFIKNNWTWEHSAKKMIDILNRGVSQ